MDAAEICNLPPSCRVLVNGVGLDVEGGLLTLTASAPTTMTVALGGAWISDPVTIIADTQEALLAAVRAERAARLAACDWTQMSDARLTPAKVAAWQAYRQALRDVPGFQPLATTETVNWPLEPKD